jgi:hypothetical protein
MDYVFCFEIEQYFEEFFNATDTWANVCPLCRIIVQGSTKVEAARTNQMHFS